MKKFNFIDTLYNKHFVVYEVSEAKAWELVLKKYKDDEWYVKRYVEYIPD